MTGKETWNKLMMFWLLGLRYDLGELGVINYELEELIRENYQFVIIYAEPNTEPVEVSRSVTKHTEAF
ncbi:MAG: hypothetical protein ACJASQ_003126 [Crocinitomicaceae bacterium]